MTGRAEVVLGRLPRHLLADERGKLFGAVVDGLAGGLDVQTMQLGHVRRAHGLRDAGEERDLLLLGGLHGLRRERLELLRLRLDEAAAADRVGEARALVAEILRRHLAGSGTVGALLGAAAAYLGLAVDSITDADARFWHLAACRDRLAPADAPTDLLALEENPGEEKQREPVPRSHGQLFEDERGGFEGDEGVTISVAALAGATLRRPMVVERDIGVGFVFEGTLGPGQEVRFGSDGTVTLDGQPATEQASVLVGAFFAEAGSRHGDDPVFSSADTPLGARFVERKQATPLPQAPRMSSGTARFAFFVDNPPARRAAVAGIGLAWQERLRFAVRLWIPARFRELDATIAERLRLLLDRHRAAGVQLEVAYVDPERCKYPDLASVPPTV